jgi:hypothetical protein
MIKVDIKNQIDKYLKMEEILVLLLIQCA